MKRGIANAFFGILSQVITVSVGFLLPKMLVSQYGSEVNGLFSSVNQILAYLALFEAGVGNATMQALYKPIVDKDKRKINAILSATNKYYNKAGFFYFISVAACALLYAQVIKTDIPEFDVAVIVILSGAGSVLNYWGFGKYKVYLQSEGHSYVANNIATISYAISNLGKFWLISRGYSILHVQSMQVVYYLLQTIGIIIYVYKKYPWINVKEAPDFSSISQKNSVLLHQVSSLIFCNTDVIILTFFCGLHVVSLYYMYNLLFTTVMNVITMVVASVVYIFGKLYFRNKQKYAIYHDLFESAYICIGMVTFVVLYIAIIPFMRLYTAGFSDMNYIDIKLPILFLIMQFLNVARGAGNNLISIVGDFKKTQKRAFAEMIINIVVSLASVKLYGIYGVLFGTIAALLYRTNDILFYSNHIILKRSVKKSYIKVFINACVTGVFVILNIKYIDFYPGSYGGLIGFTIKEGIVVGVIFCIVNFMLEHRAIIIICKERGILRGK